MLILAGTALLILGAYVSFAVPAIQLGQLWVPVNEYVPLTLQTFGVLFTGALLGARRGVAATGLYLLIGVVGLPVFAAAADGVHRSGLETIVSLEGGRVVLGATGGYLVGFLVASFVVGRLSEQGWDRRIGGSVAAMALGSAIIYAFGVTWLALAADLGMAEALGFRPVAIPARGRRQAAGRSRSAAARLAPGPQPGIGRARRTRRAGLMAAIVTESLTKTYAGHGRPWQRRGEVRALHDLSIEVREAEIFGFLGPNGAGKSTTIRLLLGFLHPTSGGGRVLDRDIATDSEEIRRRTGYLPGGIALLRQHDRRRAVALPVVALRTAGPAP